MKHPRITNFFLLPLLLSVFLFPASASHHEEVQQQQDATTTTTKKAALPTLSTSIHKLLRGGRTPKQAPEAVDKIPAAMLAPTAFIVEDTTTFPPPPPLPADDSEEVPLPPSPSDVAPRDVALLAAEDTSSHADENLPENDTSMTMNDMDMEASGGEGGVVKQEPAEVQCPVGQCPYNCATDDSGDFSCFCGPCGAF